MATCITCLYMEPGSIPFLCKCRKLLDRAKDEKNIARKIALYWAGSIMFIDLEKKCKSAVIEFDGDN